MANYSLNRYLLMTLDPLHIGTGGYRLGRVDLSIAREPGTNVPKIPGTSLSGALRQYAAYRYGKLSCAGKGDTGDESKKHCGHPTCPICYTFGHAKGVEGGYSGSVSIFDAQILLFPVHSMTGPVWVTTSPRLEAVGISLGYKAETTPIDGFKQEDETLITTMSWNQPLNLGWLMLPVAKQNNQPIQITLNPPKKKNGSASTNAINGKEWEVVSQRIVLVTEKIFSQVVNSNLEVRTSVSINPYTGAAEEGALFTYEAIPRATWLSMEIVIDDYRMDDNKEGFPNKPTLELWKLMLANGELKNKKGLLKKWGLAIEGEKFKEDIERAKKWVDADLNLYTKLNLNWSYLDDLISSSFDMAAFLGVGGMGTRGFGRIKNICHWKEA